jgi:hypothetical protein
MDDRDQKLFDLLKVKKSTESHFRKIRLAYEGPKFPKSSKGKKVDGTNEGNEIEKAVFKPTVSKSEYVSIRYFLKRCMLVITSNLTSTLLIGGRNEG